MNQVIRSWKLHRWNSKSPEELARRYDPVTRGWFNYYGSCCRSVLDRVSRQIDSSGEVGKTEIQKMQGAQQGNHVGAGLKRRNLRLFAHWVLLPASAGL